MERDSKRNSFDVTDHIGYQRLQPRSDGGHNADQGNIIHKVHTSRKACTLANSAAFDVANGQSKNVLNRNDNVSSMTTGLSQPYRTSRMLSFVTAPKVHLMHPRSDSTVPPAKYVQEDNPFVMVMYTNFSILPAYEPARDHVSQDHVPQDHTVSRTLHSRGFTPPALSAAGNVGADGTGVRTVTSATGVIASQLFATHVAGATLSEPSQHHDHIAASQASRAPFYSRPADQFTMPTYSTVHAVVPGRYAMLPTSFQDSLDPNSSRGSPLHHGLLLQSCPRQELPLQPPPQPQTLGEMRGAVRVVVQQEDQHQQLQQGFHLQQTRHIQQFPKTQLGHKFEREEQEKIQHSDQMRFPQHQAPCQVPGQPYIAAATMQSIPLHQLDRHGKNSRAIATPSDGFGKLLAKGHDRGGPGVGLMPDSVPATPVTGATTSTVPLSTAPSSPENNGSSSNGSAQREHACQHPGCTKTFDRRYNLTVHFRRHTDEMPYPCKVEGCPQRFKWRSSQSHHMKTRHQMSASNGGQLDSGKILMKRTFTNRNGRRSQLSGTSTKQRFSQSPETGGVPLKSSSEQEAENRGTEATNGSRRASRNDNLPAKKTKTVD